jgi:hypothetical protein
LIDGATSSGLTLTGPHGLMRHGSYRPKFAKIMPHLGERSYNGRSDFFGTDFADFSFAVGQESLLGLCQIENQFQKSFENKHYSTIIRN